MHFKEKKLLIGSSFYLLTSLFFIILQIENMTLLQTLVKEDGLLENASAIMYFASALLFIILWKKSHLKNIWYLAFFLLFFLIAGEEVSWGQRIFNLSTPESFESINVQQETNLHNIKGVHGIIRFVGLIIVIGICFLIPLTNKLSVLFRKFYKSIKIPVFPLDLLLFPTIAILFQATPRLLFGGAIQSMDEVGEMYLSLVFLLFAIDARRTMKEKG